MVDSLLELFSQLVGDQLPLHKDVDFTLASHFNDLEEHEYRVALQRLVGELELVGISLILIVVHRVVIPQNVTVVRELGYLLLQVLQHLLIAVGCKVNHVFEAIALLALLVFELCLIILGRALSFDFVLLAQQLCLHLLLLLGFGIHRLEPLRVQ